MLSAKERDEILRKIWNGDITLFSLPRDLQEDIIKDLQRGLAQGFGGIVTDFEEGSRDFKTLEKMNKNLSVFSSAKTFQQVKDMQNFLLDDQGFARSFTEFRSDAKIIFKQFNDNWLKTEFNIALAQGQSAAQWNDIQKEKKDLPLLKYQTAADERVRPLHAAWDNIVKPVDDPFWDERLPPNDYGCRCIVIQLEEGEEETTKLGDRLKQVREETGVKSLNNDSTLFSMNPGKQRFVFDEKGSNKHPYFKVEDRFKVLKDNNFNLPVS